MRSFRYLIPLSPLISIVFFGCGAPEPSTTLAGVTGKTVTFEEWCPAQKLQRCDAPHNIGIPIPEWQAGVDIIKEFVNSSSLIKLTRADLDRPAVSGLFTALGSASILTLLKQLPWTSLELGKGSLVLQSESADSTMSINGLTFIANGTVTAKFGTAQTLTFTGLSLKTTQLAAAAIKSLSLHDPNCLDFILENDTVTHIPLTFFTTEPIPDSLNLSPFLLLSSLAEIGLDEEFDWREKVKIAILQNSLRTMYNRLKVASQPTALTPMLDAVAGSAKSLTGGGAGTIVAALALTAPLSCKMKVSNVPILGSVEVKIDFSTGFGLSDLKRNRNGRAEALAYGLNTNFGAVKSLELQGHKMWIHVGVQTIPMDDTQANNGTISGVSCP